MKTMRIAILNVALAACSSSPKTVMLTEGFCTAGEADRCFFAEPPMDGF